MIDIKKCCDEPQLAQYPPVLHRETYILLLILLASFLIIAIGNKPLGQRLKHFIFFAQVKIHDSLALIWFFCCV